MRISFITNELHPRYMIIGICRMLSRDLFVNSLAKESSRKLLFEAVDTKKHESVMLVSPKARHSIIEKRTCSGNLIFNEWRTLRYENILITQTQWPWAIRAETLNSFFEPLCLEWTGLPATSKQAIFTLLSYTKG